MKNDLIRTISPLLLCGVVLATSAKVAHAQKVDTANAGHRVKVLLTKDTVKGHPRQELVGRLTQKGADSLWLDLGKGVPLLGVPLTAVDKLYVSMGVPTRKQMATAGAAGGALVGLATGLALVLFTDADGWDVLQHTGTDTAIGAAIGWLFPEELWKRVKR